MPEPTLESIAKDLHVKLIAKRAELNNYNLTEFNIEHTAKVMILKREIQRLEINLNDVRSKMPVEESSVVKDEFEEEPETPPEVMVIEMQGARRGPGRPRKIREEE